ncbi:Aureobasidin resistance protein Aur1, partial [Ascosphaera atra]
MAAAMSPTVASWKDSPKVMLPWKTVQMFLPHRLRRKIRSKLRSRMSPTSSISTLKRSWSPSDTLKTLNSHRWTIWDAQYLFMAALGILSLCIIQSPGPLVRALIAVVVLSTLLFPVTCQFFLPALPIIS